MFGAFNEIMMKRILFTVLIITGLFTSVFAQSDYFLLPENFYPAKGDTLKLHLLGGSTFGKAREQKYIAKGGFKFALYDGGKGPVDLMPLVKENAPVILSYKYINTGMVIVEATQSHSDEYTKREFTRYLGNSGFDDVASTLKQFQQSFTQKSIVSLKTLIKVDKNTGNVYDKPLKEDFEIVLKQNPYKLNYGDDITAVVLFKGKPIKAAKVDLVIRGIKGMETPQVLSSTEDGEIYFKLSREGTYLLHAVHLVPGKTAELDFENWQTAVTFDFRSSDTMPTSYKEFGLGNFH